MRLTSMILTMLALAIGSAGADTLNQATVEEVLDEVRLQEAQLQASRVRGIEDVGLGMEGDARLDGGGVPLVDRVGDVLGPHGASRQDNAVGGGLHRPQLGVGFQEETVGAGGDAQHLGYPGGVMHGLRPVASTTRSASSSYISSSRLSSALTISLSPFLYISETTPRR